MTVWCFEKQRVPCQLLAEIQVDAFDEEVPDAVVQKVQVGVRIAPRQSHVFADVVILKGLPDVEKVIELLERGDVILL